jgi:hypothetical protein
MKHEQIFARETTAAAMLDMPASEFRRLVDQGALPPPVTLAGHKRWRVEDLHKIASGEAARPHDDFEVKV